MVAYTGTRALDAKRGGARLALLLAILAAFAALAFAPAPALADDEVTNDEIMEVMPLDGSATVENLPDGQIQITVSSTNDSGQKVPGHLVEFEAPEGYELVSGSLKSAVQTTEDGGTLSTTAVFKKASGKKDDGGSGSGDADSKKNNGGDTGNGGKADGAKKGALPRTGDTLAYAGVAIVCVCGGVLFIMAAKKLRFKGMVLIVATVALVAASYPVPMLQAFADEAGAGNTVEYEVQDDATEGGEDATSLCDTPVTGTKTLDLSAGDQKVSVDAKVTFLVDGEHESASTVNVDTSNSIAKYATSGFVVLESSEPFAKEGISKKEGKAAMARLSGSAGTDDATASDFGYFDGSKLEFSGALEGATLRGKPIVFKTTENDEYDRDTLDDDGTVHYEMWLAVDDIPAKYSESVAYKKDESCMESSPYGYISFAQGSFDKSDETDENSLGMACVKFVDAAPTVLQVTSKTEALGSDTDVYTYDNGEFYDGSNKFKVAIDLNGLYLGMPVRDDVEGFDALETEAYTIDGVEGHTFKQIDSEYALSKGLVSLLNKETGPSVTPTALDWDDANLWVEFTVEGMTGQDAYDEFTEALERGVRISPLLTSTVGTSYGQVAYPEGVEEGTAGNGAGFAYAESDPTAVMWATDYETSGETTEITYLAAVQGASDLVSDDETVTDVNLKKKTTFTAAKQEVQSDDSTAESPNAVTSDMQVASVGVNDADNDVMELKVTVPTSEFTSSLEALGLSIKSDKSEVLGSLYSYVSGLDLRMSNGSTNAFGVSDTDKQVEIVDGASLMSGLSDADGTATVDEGQGESGAAEAPKTAAEVKSATDDISKEIKKIACDEVKSIAKTAAESGKKIFEAVTKIIKAYTESGGLGLSMLGPVGTILGAAVGLISAFNFSEKSTTYSINDVMSKLDKLESTVNGIAANTSVITLSLQKIDDSIAYGAYATRLTNLNSYMSGKQMTNLVSTLQDELGKYEDTTEEHNVCTLATPLKDMPEDAVTLVRKFVQYGNKYATLQAGKVSAEAALDELYDMICPGPAHNTNLLDAYFNYVENFYNWESETYTVRLAFIATLSQMWLNAYMVANADLALQAYDNADGYDQGQIKVGADDLQEKTSKVMNALYGDYNWEQLIDEYPNDDYVPKEETDAATAEAEDGDLKINTRYNLDKIKDGQYKDEYTAKVEEYKKDDKVSEEVAAASALQDILDNHYFTESPYAAKTHSDGTGRERLLVVEATASEPVYFNTKQDNGNSYYAKTSAYDKSCFAESYNMDLGPDNSSDDIIEFAEKSTWSAKSSFKAWQITQMVKRLNALPEALRPAITTTDNSGKEVRKAVENIDEELQSLGFKSINTAPSTTYKAKAVGIDRNNSNTVTMMTALKQYGVVNAGTADNPTPTENETYLNRNADENQNWPFVLTYAGYNFIETKMSAPFYKYGAIRQNYWVELGSSSERLLSSNIGDRIKNSGDWVITQSGGVVDGPRNLFWNWHSKARYGTVVNYKTGAVKENQLLYDFDTEFYDSLVRYYQYGNWFKRFWNRLAHGYWVNRVEFYAFGVFDLTATSAKIETGEGSGYNKGHNIYYEVEPAQFQYYTSTSRYRVENTYWTVDSEGKLYPTFEGVVDKTSRTDPTYIYSYQW